MWMLALNFGEILREFGQILGKYRIWDRRSMGSKGMVLEVILQLHIFSQCCSQLSEVIYGSRRVETIEKMTHCKKQCTDVEFYPHAKNAKKYTT